MESDEREPMKKGKKTEMLQEPQQYKDDLYGGAGGTIFGAFVTAIGLAGTMLGRSWKGLQTAESSEVKTSRPASNSWWDNLPPWLNRLSHTLNCMLAGYLIGNVLTNASHGRNLFEPSGGIMGGIIGMTGIYTIIMLGYFLKTKIGADSAK